MKSSKIGRNGPTNMSKGYSDPPESIPMVSDHFHFEGFLAVLSQALSALFSKIWPQKIENPPFPGGPKGKVWAPLSANLAFGPAERNRGLRLAPRGLQTAGNVPQYVGDLLRHSGKIAPKIWASDQESAPGTSNLGLGTYCRELWLRYLGLV